MFSGDLRDGFVGVFQSVGGRFHLLRADEGVDRHPIDPFETILDLRSGTMKLSGQLLQGDALFHVIGEKLCHIFCQGDLCIGEGNSLDFFGILLKCAEK